ncbi:MAG TPA: type 4a pilus biogenesis protein PilO [Candidatus Paceibacterota bacterium]|nr:type 4a pilus biogenesis protein PilO [Candidatus Paceibacterota bacterium]
MRLIVPIVLIALAAGLFFGFTDPLINGSLEPSTPTNPTVKGGIKALRAEKAKLDEALTNARKLSERMDELTMEYNNLPPDKLARLNQFLPDTVDNVQLIIDINNIAKAHGMSIRDVKVQTEEPKTQTSVISRSGSMEQGSVALSFVVSGPYRVFQDFLIDLSKSVRVVDINTAVVSAGQARGVYDYNVELKTYWLK